MLSCDAKIKVDSLALGLAVDVRQVAEEVERAELWVLTLDHQVPGDVSDRLQHVQLARLDGRQVLIVVAVTNNTVTSEHAYQVRLDKS